jgi:hypothetical protein
MFLRNTRGHLLYDNFDIWKQEEGRKVGLW